MGKNIIIYSDGTGQDGGARLDQRLSNIYKLYRATKIGPDSIINPSEQIAFYDPGLGTDADTRGITKFWRVLKKTLASVAGRGIAYNIVDCYEFIINHWRPGDRIFIFGFSRGAYTARCVAQVISLCGIPQHEAGNSTLSIKRFSSSARKLATEAVREVYEHGAGHPRATFEAERDEKARRFRVAYGSDLDGAPNASPYFIGVFDTVAALGAKGWKRYGIRAGLAGAAAIPILLLSWFFAAISHINFIFAFVLISACITLALLWWARRDSKRVITDYPNIGDKPRKHHIEWKADNYDRGLSGQVEYARHASAIDETRADFPRVAWGKKDLVRKARPSEPDPLVQLYFAGNHSDIGGSYSEEESRLSDIALKWMLDEVTSLPHPLVVDRSRLHLQPDIAGMQHCEVDAVRDRIPSYLSKWFKGWPVAPRIVSGFPLHPSVIARFAIGEVLQQGRPAPYRPNGFAKDRRLQHLYDGTKLGTPERIENYQASIYEIAAIPDFALRINQSSTEMAGLLAKHQATTAAIMSAWNPYGSQPGEYYNNLATGDLDTLLEVGNFQTVVAYRKNGTSLPEECRLIFGITRENAEAVGRRYGQIAIIWIEAEETPNLVVLA